MEVFLIDPKRQQQRNSYKEFARNISICKARNEKDPKGIKKQKVLKVDKRLV
jgi:hypothetical protein